MPVLLTGYSRTIILESASELWGIIEIDNPAQKPVQQCPRSSSAVSAQQKTTQAYPACMENRSQNCTVLPELTKV